MGARDTAAKARRLVVKIGTNALTAKTGAIDQRFLNRIARQVVSLKEQGRDVIIVSSGAIGSGFKELGLKKMPRGIAMRQACSAVGQSRLMLSYSMAFSRFNQKTAQVLLTYDAFSRRSTYLNLRNAFNRLLELGAIPIVNENDVVSTNEIDVSFGDNDMLSALVASKLDASLLVMLSDIGGLYTANPKKSRKAERIPLVKKVSKSVLRAAGKRGSAAAVGGMKSKVEAARVATSGGCAVVIADGRAPNVLEKIAGGNDVGTLFLPKKGMSNKKKWAFFSQPSGTIEVDKGAKQALLKRKSLLAKGILSVKGYFSSKELVEISCKGKPFARGIAGKSAERLKKSKRGTAVKTENIYIFGK